jgi:hypothetical protein
MKKQINPTIKAHLVRSAFYMLLLLAVCVIPLALAQRNTPNAAQAGARSAPGSVPDQVYRFNGTIGGGGTPSPTPTPSFGACVGAEPATLVAPFDVDYTCVGLGSVPGVPTNYGGLTLKFDDPNTLLIGGNANTSDGRIYQIAVIRDKDMHITGFSGEATLYPTPDSTIGQFVDGGVVFGPADVLFVARYPVNQIEQSLPGSSAPDKVIDLDQLGVESSVGSLGFVPPGFPGAGSMKILSYNGGGWYHAEYSPDGNGTFNITSAELRADIGGGPEGIAFVPPSAPIFPPNSTLISQYDAGNVVTAPLDSSGDPIIANMQDFIEELSGVEGAFIDPVTGDFLFSTFGGSNQVVRVSGFPPPPPTPTPTPATPTPTPTPTPATPTPTPTPVTPTPTPTPTSTATPSCTPIVVNGVIDTGDPTQTDRLFRDGIPSTCAIPKVCPGVLGDGLPRHYDSYTFTNTTGATQCVNVGVNTDCAGTNAIFTTAYLGSFDPSNLCTKNYLADIGGSPNPTGSFSFTLDDGQTVVLVVNEVDPDAGCAAYTMTVDGLCGGGTPTPTPTATPTATTTPSVTPTATPTATPRVTPRPRPTPHPRPPVP